VIAEFRRDLTNTMPALLTIYNPAIIQPVEAVFVEGAYPKHQSIGLELYRFKPFISPGITDRLDIESEIFDSIVPAREDVVVEYDKYIKEQKILAERIQEVHANAKKAELEAADSKAATELLLSLGYTGPIGGGGALNADSPEPVI
jgi:hypothetical protein